MKAVVATQSGAQLREVPVPEPKAGELLVRVKACSLNRADLAGLAAKNDKVLGMEWAGVVEKLGAGVSSFRPGDRVMCTGAGAYAEYAVTDAGRACAIPAPELSFEEATILTLALQTMHDALATQGRVTPGESVLIQGASSGVGLMALQIAKRLGAGLVIGTSTNAARRAQLKDYGADLALDTRDPAWVQAAVQATGGKGVDVIIDQVSGPLANANMEAAAVLGRIVNVGRLGGTAAPFDFNLHALKRISYIGVTFRTRSAEEIRALNAKMLADLREGVARRELRLPIDRVYPLERATEALARMAANEHFGKIVLAV